MSIEELINKLPDTKDGLNWHIAKTLQGKYRVYYGMDYVEDSTLERVLIKATAPTLPDKEKE